MAFTFYVMTYKGYTALEKFIEAFGTAPVDQVVSARDPHVTNDYYSEIKTLCESRSIRFTDRKKAPPLQGETCFAISWKWLIQGESSRVIVFHDSLLPRYRGFAPLPSALINGEKKIGVTALSAAKEFDRGDIILQASASITYPIKIKKAIDIVAGLYGTAVVAIGRDILSNKPLAYKPQNEKEATYSLWRDDRDYIIDWTSDAGSIKRFVDSVGYPYKGASSLMDTARVRILDVEEEPDVVIENRVPGKVLFLREGYPSVVCGTGLLKVTQMIDAETKHSLLPLKNLRTRFQ